MMNTADTTLPMPRIRPLVNTWLIASTSLEIRLTSSPTAVRSKKATPIRCQWAKMALRRPNITRWPIRLVSWSCAYRARPLTIKTRNQRIANHWYPSRRFGAM
jgi:hypothetical protein